MTKRYSIYVHALHSRLQMIRNRLDIELKMDPSQVVIRNQKYFNKAGKSVEEHHSYRCNRSDYYDAAELLLVTISTNDSEILTLPLWNKSQLLSDWSD